MESLSPASMGYRMPAEWEKHEATWLSWPYNMNTWGEHLEGAEDTTAAFVRELVQGERVDLLVANKEVHERARKKLAAILPKDAELRYHLIESGDVWIRDYGPIFVTRDTKEGHGVGWTKWQYNALGKPEYEDLLPGNSVPDLLPIADKQRFDAGMVLEGGSIDVNGTGTLLTTESCLLHPSRNPNMTKAEIEKRLQECLGVTNILWLKAGIEGDDTDGHIDDLTRFVGPSTVVTVVEEDPKDNNYAVLKENAERLKTMQDERGTPLRVIPLPMPRPLVVEGRRMAASYANFYIANSAVIVPIFHQLSDDVALKILRTCFPDRNVVGIDCREFIWGCGSLHCSSQQQPA